MLQSFDETIGLLTNHTNRKIIRYLNSRLEQYDITIEQWGVLLKLSQSHQVNQKQLADRVDKDPSTLLRILDILERKGLVERRQSIDDRRYFYPHLTGKGRNLKETVVPFIESEFAKILQGIPNQKIDIFVEVLIQLSENISKQSTGG